MKTKLMISLMLGLTITIGSCRKEIFGVKGKGPVKTEFRNETGFTAIETEIDAEIIVIQDSIFSIEVQAQENILEVLKTKVKEQTLKIEYERRVQQHAPIVITIHLPKLNALELSGSGEIKVPGLIQTNHFEVEITGSGNIAINELQSADFEAEITGSGNLSIEKGKTTWSKLEIMGSGNMYLSNMIADETKVEITGSGDAEVQVLNVLTVYIAGSGNVYYIGTPNVHVSITGSGELKHL